MIKKAIFPVGGLGTRFLPATKSMPKEMLTIVDKPLIQYAVEEAAAAGIEEFIFVTGRNKSAIEDHFDHKTIIDINDPHLEDFKNLQKLGLAELTIFDGVGAEKFAEHAFNFADKLIREKTNNIFCYFFNWFFCIN